MSKKHEFRPFHFRTRPDKETLYKLNAIAALHQGYAESELPLKRFAQEFYLAVGEIFAGERLPDLKLDYLEIVGDVE